jgi:phosphatidylinositol alpha-1,6-mannosyltransferase
VAGQVREAARQVGLSEQVVFAGRLDDDEMAGAFQLADVFVLPVVPRPGDMEGFGIVLLEAAASGTPSVATRIGGIPDAVADGETGVLVPSLDYGAMADALIRLLTDDHLREQVASRGRERVMRDYLWEKVAPRYADAVLRF